MRCRKAQSSVLAVEERQSLETLSRDEKTSSRTLAQLKDKVEQFTTQRSKLGEDEEASRRRRTEVCTRPLSLDAVLISIVA